jgi:hypothetical protein
VNCFCFFPLLFSRLRRKEKKKSKKRKANSCFIHTGLSLRKLCEEQGGMLMLGCFCTNTGFCFLFFKKKKKEKRKAKFWSQICIPWNKTFVLSRDAILVCLFSWGVVTFSSSMNQQYDNMLLQYGG